MSSLKFIIIVFGVGVGGFFLGLKNLRK